MTADGDLFARGNAHRGQYGDGRLDGTQTYARVASRVLDIKSHTGHAILLTDRGDVQGTGGNIYGPLGRHGLGDKAVGWGTVLDGATGIATGASHSLAMRADKSLWIWGRNESPDPRRVLADVVGVAAGSARRVALTQDGVLWQWRTGARPRRVLDCPGYAAAQPVAQSPTAGRTDPRVGTPARRGRPPRLGGWSCRQPQEALRVRTGRLDGVAGDAAEGAR